VANDIKGQMMSGGPIKTDKRGARGRSQTPQILPRSRGSHGKTKAAAGMDQSSLGARAENSVIEEEKGQKILCLRGRKRVRAKSWGEAV